MPILTTPDFVESLLAPFQQQCAIYRFANHAYSFMPDHVHFVVEGQSADSELCALVRTWKSKTAFHFKRAHGKRLWQRTFFDRVMRDRDEMTMFSRYVIDNPVRAGLPDERRRDPFVGSDTATLDQIRRGDLPGGTFCKYVV